MIAKTFSTFILVILLFSSNLIYPTLVQESYVYRYSKYDRVGLNGMTVISKSTFDNSGHIEFKKNQVTLSAGASQKKFRIEKYVKHKDGYQINAYDPNGERCLIGIINRQGIDFVVFHYIDQSYMLMHHISSGFNLNMKIYN